MPHVELPQAEFKVVMLGNTNVGKTSLVLRFAEGYYRENSRSPTVGAFFITKRLLTESGITCKVQIWDTAGQAQFRKMAPMYYKTAAAAILCYDVCNVHSFHAVREWVEELSSVIQAGNIVIAIAATKSDLMDEPTTEKSCIVPPSQAMELAKSMDAIFVDTSARNDENVNLLFQKVAERVLLVREQARSRGLDVKGGMDSIPVTPGASINEHGRVVKGYATTTTNNTMTTMTNQEGKTNYNGSNSSTMASAMDSTTSTHGAASATHGLAMNHPIQSLQRESPERSMDRQQGNGQQQQISTRGDVRLEEESRSSSVGLCMGPLMECSSSKGDASCTIC